MLVKCATLVIIFLINIVLCDMGSYDNDYNSSESKILFPGRNDFTNQEIPLEIIRRLNMLSSMEDFFRNMVETESLELRDRLGEDTIERSLVKSSMTGKCMPEYTTVSLKPDKTTTTFYYPRCTRVKRCGGCCLHDLFWCRPVEKEFVPVTLAIAEYRGGNQFRFKGRKIVEIEQHTKCECGCKIQPEHCTKYQIYSPERCRCECPNSDNERKCYKKIWNPDICSCICKDELTCGTGFEFDPFTCSCVSSRGRKKPSFVYQIYL